MAKHKPLSQLSPGYRRRIARGLAKGKTWQESRGHTKGEAAERRRRDIAAGRLTTTQRQQVSKYAREQTERMDGKGADATEQIEILQGWAMAQGYDQFKTLRDWRNRAIRDLERAKAVFRKTPRRRGVKRDKPRVRSWEEMVELSARLNLPDERWLWYH